MGGTAHAQNFFIEQSAPAHGAAGVPLSDTVAFSFNRQVAISTDWNTAFVYEPRDALTFDEVSLCLTFLDVCDAGTDVPRHVRYQVEHQPNTDYTWLVYAVQGVEGDSMSTPYVLRYTTAPQPGEGQVQGAVAAPAPMPARSAATRTTLRTLATGLKQSHLGQPVFAPGGSSPSAHDSTGTPENRPQARVKTLGAATGSSGGPYTQVLLVDDFSIDKTRWSVRAADVLLGTSGSYTLDFVRSGSYVPIAVRYTDGTNTDIDALGFHDPDGDGRPNSIDVEGGTHPSIDLQLFEFPRTTARAASNLPVAIDSAEQYASDSELRWIEAEHGMRSTGTAYAWTYRFYSASQDLETTVTVNPLTVTVDTTAAFGFITEMSALSSEFIDSDEALQMALNDGGQAFIEDYPPRNRTTVLSGGNLYWTDTPHPGAAFWRVRLIGQSGSDTDTFERYIDIETGEVLPVELTHFTASRTESGVELQWRTASETNNSGFEVQHAPGDSTSRGPWTSLGFVDGAGTTQVPQTYRFRATDVDPGRHRFRLKQVDLDGTTRVSAVVSIMLAPQAPLQLTAPAPNPIRHGATFRIGSSTNTTATVALYDVLGRRVRTLYDAPLPANQPQTVRLKARRLSSGAYFLRLTTPHRSRSRKVTVKK